MGPWRTWSGPTLLLCPWEEMGAWDRSAWHQQNQNQPFLISQLHALFSGLLPEHLRFQNFLLFPPGLIVSVPMRLLVMGCLLSYASHTSVLLCAACVGVCTGGWSVPCQFSALFRVASWRWTTTMIHYLHPFKWPESLLFASSHIATSPRFSPSA